MKDVDCVRFLQWALPQIRLRWAGFRKVRRQVCKRVERRRRELGLDDPLAYRHFLEANPDEWQVFDSLCRISISRFFRDRGTFHCLADTVLPELARMTLERPSRELRCWSAGCASGEEPFSLRILWELRLRRHFPEISLHIVATDSDAHLLSRAGQGCYQWSSLKEIPREWLATAFEQRGDAYCLRQDFRRSIDFACQDIRRQVPHGPFDLIFCRNLVFTYFEARLQQDLMEKILSRLAPRGALVIGRNETLPAGSWDIEPWNNARDIFQRAGR